MSSSPSTLTSGNAPPGRRVRRAGFRSIFDNNSFLLWGLIPILLMVPWWTTILHFRLPTPKVELFSPDGLPQISEARILSHVAELTDPNVIGYRTVGTKAHALGDEWAVEHVKALVTLCNEVKAKAKAEGRTVDLECEWDRQQGSGTHKFDIMNRIIYKSYQNLTNILFRISSSRPESKTLAILLNSHLDSTLPSPGAADDALCVAMSLEIARYLIESVGKGTWEVGWGIVFLFNNAEESFQDASHLFSTQHPWAETIRTVVNLEAAGSTGPELLFQATSEEMVWAYQGVPYPHGTVVANDIFASGIMMSDTDFRQFDQYLLVPGIDLAVIGHSYFYHTSKDTVENIEPGVAQHFAENVLEITKHMTAREKDAQGNFKESSVLQRVKKFTPDLPTVASKENDTPAAAASSMGALPFASADMGGQQHSRRPDVVFYSLFGLTTIVYTGSTARWLYSLWALFCALLVLIDSTRTTRSSGNGSLKPANGFSKAKETEKTPISSSSYATLLVRCSAFLLYTLFRSLAYVNVVAFIMRSVLGKQLSWFAGEWRPIGLYVWFALLGLMNTPPKFIIPSHIRSHVLERSLLHASLLLNVSLAVIVQLIGIGSAAMFFLISVGVGFGIAVGLVLDTLIGAAGDGSINSLVYLVGTVIPLAMGCELALGTLDVFIPLTGRMPPFVPAEHIIATLVAFFTFLSLPLLPPLINRLPQLPALKVSGFASLSTVLMDSIPNSLDSLGQHHVMRSVGAIGIGAVLWFAFISGWGDWPFDSQHPKRIFISFTEDVSASSYGLHIASMDGAAGFPQLATELSQKVAIGALPGALQATDNATDPRKVTFDLWNTDWNSFYPLGELFDHYSFSTTPPLPLQYSPAWKNPSRFGIKVLNDRVNEAAGTRSLKLEMRHSGVIWTVLAFDAHVLSWSIDDNPPNEYTRHHIKEASFYGSDKWTLEMVILLNPIRPKLYQERAITNGHSSGIKPGTLELSFSGMVEKGMWPAKKWDWEREAKAKKSLVPDATWSIAMAFFEDISRWMDETRKGSTDTFMVHNVVRHVTI